MLQSKENSVKIEGILSEIDLESRSYAKDGRNVECISGSIKVRVTQVLNGKEVELEVPVYLFSNKLTKAGAPNPAYTSIEKVMKEFKSIAAVGLEEADRVRITGASIRMNEYYGTTGNLNSYPRIHASFINKITDMSKYSPEATFSAIFAIGDMNYETDKDGVEIPDRYKIRGILPQYGGTVDVVDFFALSPNVINGISGWQRGDTVKVLGKLNFTSRVEEKLIEVDFGEPQVRKQTVSVSELVITGGSAAPLEGDFAFDWDEIEVALKERQTRLAALKEKGKSEAPKKAAPAPAKRDFSSLGF